MKRLVVVFHSHQQVAHNDIGIQFLSDFATQGFLGALARLNLTAGKLPPVLILTITSLRGKNLPSRIYQIKASNYIIENLLNTCTDTDSIVNNWIDSPEVNIRENNGFDNLTDYLLAKQPKFPMTQINDSETALAETLSYVESVMPKDEELQAKCVEKQNAVREEFHKLITEQINRQCGVGTVEKVILGLESQIDIMLGEMRSERDALTDKAPRLEQGLKAVVNDLTEYGRKFFKIKSKEEEKQNEAMTAALQLAICRREIKRRETAIQFGAQCEDGSRSTEPRRVGSARHRSSAACRSIAQLLNSRYREHRHYQPQRVRCGKEHAAGQ